MASNSGSDPYGTLGRAESDGGTLSDDQKESAETASSDQDDGGQTRDLVLSRSEAFVAIMDLLRASPVHRSLFVSDLEWLVAPALSTGQFRLFGRDGRVFGALVWAVVSDDVDTRLSSELGPVRLHSKEWISGSNAWVVDIFAPYGDVLAMVEAVKQSVFPDKDLKARPYLFAPDGLSSVRVF